MIDPQLFGVSFSLKQCRNFGLYPHETLDWLLTQGWRRFRLMSYWNTCEKTRGEYDFSNLDWQVHKIANHGGVVTMCLGVKQPRWPEYHWPKWALELPAAERDMALQKFVEATVRHFQNEKVIISWQLENEALLSNFGKQIHIDRRRLRSEYELVKKLDPARPISMSTSNGWGIPWRRPRPDIVGFSQYFVRWQHGKYHKTKQPAALHRFRRLVIRLMLGRPSFIHELQLEPWGPSAIWHMSKLEQSKSMNAAQIKRNIAAAKSVKAPPIDCWGGEWWYWRYKNGDNTIWQAVSEAVQ